MSSNESTKHAKYVEYIKLLIYECNSVLILLLFYVRYVTSPVSTILQTVCNLHEFGFIIEKVSEPSIIRQHYMFSNIIYATSDAVHIIITYIIDSLLQYLICQYRCLVLMSSCCPAHTEQQNKIKRYDTQYVMLQHFQNQFNATIAQFRRTTSTEFIVAYTNEHIRLQVSSTTTIT